MKKKIIEAFSTKAKYRGIIVINATVSNLAKEIRDSLIVDAGKAYINSRSREN